MSLFIFFDLSFLIAAVIFVSIFLYSRRHKLERQGLLFLYKTKLGIALIEKISKRYSLFLRALEPIVIASGYLLMAGIIWLLSTTLLLYIRLPDSSPIVKVPAIFPLIPYFPQIFNIESFFPPFYFIYFLIAIAVVALSHEFSHGIFARLNKIKIHSTGFAFLGPFLGAFVEQDEKQMNRASIKAQLSVLAAGTFANIIMAVLFGILLVFFFKLFFLPAGFIFNSYATSAVPTAELSLQNGIPLILAQQESFNTSATLIPLLNIRTNTTYFATPDTLFIVAKEKPEAFYLYDDSPALRANLSGAIIAVNDRPIRSYEDIHSALGAYKPQDNITIKTLNSSEAVNEYHLALGERDNRSFLGIGILSNKESSFRGFVQRLFSLVKDPFVYYQSRIGSSGQFIYDLLWWVVIINFFVALFNMFPAGILDGGRFLYLTVQKLSGSRKAAGYTLKATTWLFLFVVLAMMIKWAFSIF